MKIKLITISIFLLLFMAQLQASPGYAYPQPGQNTPLQASGPGAVLREGVTKLLQFMRQPEAPSPEMIAVFLDDEIAPYFDFDYMAKWTAGPAYRNMSEQQRSLLEEKIKGILEREIGEFQ